MRLLGLISRRSGNPGEEWALATRSERATSLPSAHPETVFDSAAADLGSALGAGHCMVLLNRNGPLRVVAQYHKEEKEDVRELEVKLDLARLLDGRASEAVKELARLVGGARATSALAAPIAISEEPIGAVLVFETSRARKWTHRERQLARAVASGVALAIDKIESQSAAETAGEREALMTNLLTAIRAAYSLEDLLRVAVQGIGQTLGVTRALLYQTIGQPEDKPEPEMALRVEYRAGEQIPSAFESRSSIEATPLLGQALAGDIVAVSDTSLSHPVVRAVGVTRGIRALLLAPIITKGRAAALLVLEQHDRARVFSNEDLRLVRVVTDQTAIALYQTELSREAREAERREALVGKVSSAIHLSLDQEAVLQTIVDELGAALSVCRCSLALLPDPMPEQVAYTHQYVAACCAEAAIDFRSFPVPNNVHLQSVLSTHRPLAVDDVAVAPGPYFESLSREGVRSLAATAIRLGGRPVGVITLEHFERRHLWTKWEIDLVQSVAEHAAVAIRQAEFYREVRESATRAALINQIVASIRRSLDLEETLRVTVNELGRALDAGRVIVSKQAGNHTEIVAEFLHSTAPSRVEAGGSGTGAAVTATTQPRPFANSEIVCPIVVNGKPWGSLSIKESLRAREWSPGEVALVEAVTAQVEVAVSHSHLFAEAQQAARREALISRIIHGVNQSNTLDEIFPMVARGLCDYLQSDRFVIARLSQPSGRCTIECVFSDGKVSAAGNRFPSEQLGGLLESIEAGLVLCSDSQSDDGGVPQQLRHIAAAPAPRSFMAVPVLYNREPRLVFAAIMDSSPREWSAEEVEIVAAAADQVLIAFQRAELFEEISHGKHEWEATFEALTDGIFIFDRHGVLRRVNPAAAAMEGRSVNELIGRRCCTIMPGIEGETCRVAPVILAGRPETFELTPHRLSRPVLVTISPLVNGDGPVGAVCIVRDLSELRAAEAAARNQRSFLAKLIEHANDAIFALSAEGRIIWFNEQLGKLTGYSREELFACDYTHFVPPDEKTVAAERFARAWAGEAQTFEMRGPAKKGEGRLLLVTYTPIYDEDRVSSILSIARDVTEERLAAERAAQADKFRALGQLASGVAHNFNNILAAILGHAQLIKRDARDDRVAQRIDIIERAALDGAQTVKRIQGFALQQNDDELELVDVNHLVQDSSNLTRARWCDDALSRGLTYEVELRLNTVPPVRGVPSELREVFVNLILNALDAMPKGGRLLISTHRAGLMVRVAFTDHGVGMSREVRERIFEPFFTTKSSSGMGLGLAVSYSIIERHRGSIEVISAPREGSTFVLTLPTARPAQRSLTNGKSPEVRSATLLVIDDDEWVCDALAGLLSSSGHSVEQAVSGREGLEKMEKRRFDLVITDLSMPEMDGWAVAARIRRRWPDVKVVLATGFALSDETLESRRSLVDAVVVKPIRIDDITATLSQVLP